MNRPARGQTKARSLMAIALALCVLFLVGCTDPYPNQRRAEAQQMLGMARDNIREFYRAHDRLPEDLEETAWMNRLTKPDYFTVKAQFETLEHGRVKLTTKRLSTDKSVGTLTFDVDENDYGQFSWNDRP